jgi:hypothetical protein
VALDDLVDHRPDVAALLLGLGVCPLEPPREVEELVGEPGGRHQLGERGDRGVDAEAGGPEDQRGLGTPPSMTVVTERSRFPVAWWA